MSFLWGISRLENARTLCGFQPRVWTFGQIMPVLLLLAPLVTFSELLSEGELSNSFPPFPLWFTLVPVVV
jgi:hypothetical protein